jgi:DNA-directed RNA polymerase subunit L
MELYSSQNNLIINSEVTIPNCFDIILENEDYTIGKILEYTLYKTYYLDQKTINFCGFRKPHPHINISIIRLAFNAPTEKTKVVEYINNSATTAIQIYKKILERINT